MTYCFIKCRSDLLIRQACFIRVIRLCNQRLLRPLKVYALGACSSQLPSSFAQICPRSFLWAHRATHQLCSGCSCGIFFENSYVAMVRTTQKPNSSFVFCFAHLCPHFARQVRRTKPRFIRVCSCGIFFENSYVAIVQLQLAFSTKARLGASACAYCISILFFSLINLS